MKVYIKLEGDVIVEDFFYFKEFVNFIKIECDLFVKVEEIKLEFGVKDGGLVIGLNIVLLILIGI